MSNPNEPKQGHDPKNPKNPSPQHDSGNKPNPAQGQPVRGSEPNQPRRDQDQRGGQHTQDK